MDATIPCPECGRVARFPAIHLGRRFKCPGCGAIVATTKPELGEPYAPPRARIGPEASSQNSGEKGAGWHFHAKVKGDPAGLLEGFLDVEVTPLGLVLRKPKGG